MAIPRRTASGTFQRGKEMEQTETGRLAFLASAIRAVEYYRTRGRLTDASAVAGLLADYAAGMTDRREETILEIMVDDWHTEAD
jgi:hypothetical protein